MTRAKTPTYRLYFRRRRDGQTNYKKRLALVKSNIYRLVVRKSNKSVMVQVINFNQEGDKTVAAAHSRDLIKFAWSSKRNIYTAYLTGLLAARKAQKKNIVEAVADFGLYPSTKWSILFAAVKGAVDGGMKISVGDEMIPKEKLEKVAQEINEKFQKTKGDIMKI